MTPPSNAGGEGREVLAREVLAEHAKGAVAPCMVPHAIAAMLAFSARENADDRAPALVEAAVAVMRERAAKVCDSAAKGAEDACRSGHYAGPAVSRLRDRARASRKLADAIRALPTPSQKASNVG